MAKGWPAHRRRPIQLLDQIIVERYQILRSQKEVAAELEISPARVCRTLKRMDVEVISRGQQRSTCLECERPVEKRWHKVKDRPYEAYWTGRRCRLHQMLRDARASREYQRRKEL